MFLLTIYTIEKVVFEEYIQSLSVPATTGYLEVLTNHAPLMAILEQGTVTIIKKNRSIQHYRVSGGLLEVRRGDVVALFADDILQDERDT